MILLELLPDFVDYNLSYFKNNKMEMSQSVTFKTAQSEVCVCFKSGCQVRKLQQKGYTTVLQYMQVISPPCGNIACFKIRGYNSLWLNLITVRGGRCIPGVGIIGSFIHRMVNVLMRVWRLDKKYVCMCGQIESKVDRDGKDTLTCPSVTKLYTFNFTFS